MGCSGVHPIHTAVFTVFTRKTAIPTTNIRLLVPKAASGTKRIVSHNGILETYVN